MTDKNSLLQGSAELKTAANKAYDDLLAGKITQADFDTAMEHCEKESEKQGVRYKNMQRAQQFTTSIVESGEPPAQKVPDGLQEYHKSYEQLFKAAKPSTKSRASAAFNFGFANALEAGLKTQGVANLAGENSSGTSAGSALGGAYFLGGTVGDAIQPEFIPGVVEMRFYPTVIESLFPALPVSSPVVTYVTESTWTNNAAATGEGATKPTSAFGYTRHTEQVGKVANLARATDEMIQDAAYIWALIQRRLVMGVQRRTEVELLAGSGYPGVNGLLGRSASFTSSSPGSAINSLSIPPVVGGPFGTGMGSAETVSSVTPGYKIVAAKGSTNIPTGNDIALGVLTMITDIRTQTFFEPDAIVMSPLDWQTVRTATDANGQYYGGSFFGRDNGYPADAGQLNGGATDTFGLWGKKLVTTPVLPAGLVLVGDFADAGAVLRLGGLRVDITNTNGTDFEQNLFTARAESRVGLLVERPYLFSLGVVTTSGNWSS